MPNTSSIRSMRSPVNPPPRSVWNTSMPPNGKRSAANAASTRSASRRVPTAWPAISRFASSPGRHMHAHELPPPHVGRVGGDVRVRGRSHRIRGRGCSGPDRRSAWPDAAGTGPSNTSPPCPGLHDPVDAAARHDDARMPRGVLDLPAPIDLAAVAPHALRVTLMGGRRVRPRGGRASSSRSTWQRPGSCTAPISGSGRRRTVWPLLSCEYRRRLF